MSAETPENIKPYDSGADNKGEQVEQMFDSIAPAYDFMNTAMTFGLHRHWRNKALRKVKRHLLSEGVSHPHILDLACGTGDVTFHLARILPDASIVGADLSRGMLDVAVRKLDKCSPGTRERVSFCQADALALPFETGSFDVVTIAYGVRNFENLPAGYSEMLRVLRPGGLICVIELCEPGNKMMRGAYKFYSRTLIPLTGRLVSKDPRAYSYLPESIAACPARVAMTALMTRCGFKKCDYRALFPGVCSVYIGHK